MHRVGLVLFSWLAVNMGALQNISTSAFLIVIMSQLGISANCMKLCQCQLVIPFTIYHTTKKLKLTRNGKYFWFTTKSMGAFYRN